MMTKRILALITIILLVTALCLPCFADRPAYGEEQWFDNLQLYNPNQTVGQFEYSREHLDDDGLFDSFTARFGGKNTGVIGASVALYDGYIPSFPRQVLGNVSISMPYTGDSNPRFNMSVCRGRMWVSSQTLSAFEYLGWTIRVRHTVPDLTGVYLDFYRTTSFTLDYPSVETYYFSLDELNVDANDNIELNLQYSIDLNNSRVYLYLFTASGLKYLDELIVEVDSNYGLDFTSVRFGVHDSIDNYDVLLLNSWYVNISDAYNQEAYQAGYDDGVRAGVEEGYDYGFRDGIIEGREIGIEEGYEDGYRNGYNEGSLSEGSYIDVPAIFDGVFEGVGGIFRSFDLTIFGISVGGLLLSILVAGFVIFIIKKVK